MKLKILHSDNAAVQVLELNKKPKSLVGVSQQSQLNKWITHLLLLTKPADLRKEIKLH